MVWGPSKARGLFVDSLLANAPLQSTALSHLDRLLSSSRDARILPKGNRLFRGAPFNFMITRIKEDEYATGW